MILFTYNSLPFNVGAFLAGTTLLPAGLGPSPDPKRSVPTRDGPDPRRSTPRPSHSDD